MPTAIDRGITPDGEGLELDGRSLVRSILDGTDSPHETAMTVSSHNTHQPHTYPDSGPEMWRCLGLRSTDRWHVWDGVDRSRTLRRPDGEIAVEGGDAEPWDRLEDEWRRAVAAGPTLPRELFAVRSGPEDPDDDGDAPGLRMPGETGGSGVTDGDEILRKMRMLGYID